ncbi:MAG: septum formation initiator family protein [Patescibacteria group bacterium]|nr:septum formation initiator family protein [Patescibacteria group bacterium]
MFSRSYRANATNGGFWRRRGVIIANLALLALALWGVVGEYWRSRDLRAEIVRIQGEVEGMEEENFDLARQGRQYGTDAALEREARVKLGLQKPGESVIIVRDGPLPSPSSAIAANAKPGAVSSGLGPLANARKWWNYFFAANAIEQPKS